MFKKIIEFYLKFGAFLSVTAWFSLSSRLLRFWVTVDDIGVAYSEGDSAQRIQLLAITFFVVPLLIYRRNLLFTFFKKNIWILFLFIYCLISILWAQLPAIALKRFIRLTCYLTIFSALFTDTHPFRTFINSLSVSVAIIIGLSIIVILAAPEQGYNFVNGENLIRGVCAHKNQLGQWAFTATVLFMWNFFKNPAFKKRILNIIAFSINAYILYASKSMTSFLMTIIACSIILLYFLFKRYGWKGGFAVISLILTLITATFVVSEFLLKSSLITEIFAISGKNFTFSGRTDLWQQVILFANKTFMLGNGYGTFWLTDASERIRILEGWDIFQAHNGYLDTYLHLGIAGCVLTLLYLINGIVGNLRLLRTDAHAGILFTAYLSALLIGNFTETLFSFQNHEFWFLSLVTCVSFVEKRRVSYQNSALIHKGGTLAQT